MTKQYRRMFPSYTVAELKAAALDTARNTPEQIELLRREVAAREAGISVVRVTPQVAWR